MRKKVRARGREISECTCRQFRIRVVSMLRKDGTWKEVHAKNNNSWRGARVVARARTHLPHGLCRTPL